MSDSRGYPGKIRLGFALFFGTAAWLITSCLLVSFAAVIAHPTASGGPTLGAIIIPILVCAATLLAAPGAIICALRPSWLTTFYPRAWRTAAILCYSVALPGLLTIGAHALYVCYRYH